MPWATRSEDEVVAVGPYVRLRHVGDVTTLFVAAAPILRLHRSDKIGLRAELAALESLGVVTQSAVARSGLVSEATFHRACLQYRSGGEEVLRARGRRGRPSKLTPDVLAEVRRLHHAEISNVAIAVKLGMTESTVRRGLQQLGVAKPLVDGAPSELFAEKPAAPAATDVDASTEGTAAGDASSEDAATAHSATSDAAEEMAAVEAVIALENVGAEVNAKTIAAQRAAELSLGRLGLLPEQSALFPTTTHAPHAGVLLALSLLSITGLLEEVRNSLPVLPNGLYGARSIVTTLVAMAVLRCKRAEQLKGFDPTALGAVVGLARAPEMKTLRAKLRLLGADQEAVKHLVRAMAKRHVDRAKDAIAFLYIDGHVRPYFGDRELSKAHHTAMRISLPATTDYWVNDADGAPVLVMITEGNAAMTKTMPALLDEVRAAVGATARPTVVFDRGGYSAKLFKLVLDRQFDLITYRKGKHRKVARNKFTEITIERAGRERPVLVHDGRVQIRGYGRIRCVAVCRPDGKQTHVLTSRTDLSAREILERMFSRWQQENFFKYLDEEYAFDALWTYRTAAADPTRTVPNPLRKKLDRRIAELRREIARRTANLGDIARTARPLDPETKRAELEAQVAASREIAETEAKLATLRERRSQLPQRVPVGSIREDDVVELASAPMLLCDVIKMTAFHIETMLVAAIGASFKRVDDEGRAVIADFMRLDGSFEARGDVLFVTLHRPSAPRFVKALGALCIHLNELDPRFPETTTRLQFAVADAEPG